jgi:transposase
MISKHQGSNPVILLQSSFYGESLCQVGEVIGLRWIARTGAQWLMMPNELLPWFTVCQQAQRWIAAGVFEDIVHDLRTLIRLGKGRKSNHRQLFSVVARSN